MLYVRIPEGYQVEQKGTALVFVSSEPCKARIAAQDLVTAYFKNGQKGTEHVFSRIPSDQRCYSMVTTALNGKILCVYKQCVVGKEQWWEQIRGAQRESPPYYQAEGLSEGSIERIKKARQNQRDQRRGPERRY